MIVKYTPEGGAPVEYEFHARRVKASVAEMIERRAGMRFEEWANEILAGSATARRVLLWHLFTREHPAIRFEDVDFAYGELEIENNLSELLKMRAAIEASAEMDADVRAVALGQIDADITKRRDAGDEEPVAESGKA